MRKTIFMILLVLSSGSLLMSQGNEAIRFEKNKPIALLGNSAKAFFYDKQKPDEKLFSIVLEIESEQAGESVLKNKVIDQIVTEVKNYLEKGNARENLKLKWADKNDRLLIDNLLTFYIEGVDKQPQGKSGGSSAEIKNSLSTGPYESVDEAESGLLQYIHALERAGDFKYSVVIFNEDLSFRRAEPSRNTVGDLVYVCVIYSGTSETGEYSVEFSPCSLEPESPMLFIGETASLAQLQSRSEKEKYFVKYFSPRRCYNSSITIKIKKGASLGSYNFMQYNRYRGTLQVGILSTDQHINEFGLQEKAGKKIIYDKGPSNTGPEYFASLLIYSLPRYIETLFSKEKHYSGRDIINESSFGDRLGVVFGVGLNNPAKRFVLGFSFEALYGVNVIGVFDFARLNELGDGLKIGDKFSGKEEDIPVHYHWERKFVFGISLDLRYITALFSRR